LKSNETIGEMIVRLRKQKSWIQEELADYSGVSRNHLSSLENDKVLPDYERIMKLTRVLDVSPSTFTDNIGRILDQRYDNGDFPEIKNKMGV
jgi:transcriptional regulator with XRE-family HTH domain